MTFRVYRRKRRNTAQRKSDTQRLPLFLSEGGTGWTGWTGDLLAIHDAILQWPLDKERHRELSPTSSPSTFSHQCILPVTPFASLYPPIPSPCLLPHLAGHFHGLADCSDSLGAVGVGAGARAGPVHGAGTCQGRCSGASQSGHTGRRHWWWWWGGGREGPCYLCDRQTKSINNEDMC